MERGAGRAVAVMGRRRLMAWLGAAAAASSLQGCGGGGKSVTDPVGELERYQQQKRLDEQAAACRKDGLVGVVLARIAGPDAALLRAAAGSTRLTGGQALGGNERFMIGSNTKAMTAALAAQCVERGMLHWDSKPAELLPELKSSLHPGYQSLTLGLLLDHKGGLPAFTGEDDPARFIDYLSTYQGSLPADETGRRRFFCTWLLGQAPVAKVGEDFLYSNAGYALAGAMLEAASGQRFQALFDTLLSKPLKLDLQWGPPQAADQPRGYVGDTPALLKATQPLPSELQIWWDVLLPSGDANLAVDGYGQWLRWHAEALRGRNTPLPAAYVSRVRTLKAGQYALGWLGSEVDGRAIIFHTGADQGFMAIVALAQDGNLALYGLTNTFGWQADGSSWVLDSLNRAALGLLKA